MVFHKLEATSVERATNDDEKNCCSVEYPGVIFST